MSLRPLKNVQLTVSIHADKGLLHKSSGVRFRLRVRPDAALVALPSSLGQPLECDELSEFPSESLPMHAVAPRAFLKSMLRVSTLVAFAAGVAVGASGRLELKILPLSTVEMPPLPAHVPVVRRQPDVTPPPITRPTQPAVVATASVVSGMFRHPIAQ